MGYTEYFTKLLVLKLKKIHKYKNSWWTVSSELVRELKYLFRKEYLFHNLNNIDLINNT